VARLRRIVNLFRPERLQADLDKELAFHLMERADDLEAAGMSRQDALRSARLQFGKHSVQVERTRDMDINQTIEATLRNLRQAVRGLAKAPGFAAAVVATLALGIGANSAVFSAIYAVVLRPLPFPDADRLVTVGQTNPRVNQSAVAPVRLADWNRLNTTFQAITGYYIQHESEISGDVPERIMRAFVARRFLQVWGVSPALGRDFTPDEERSGGPPAVLISDRLWRRRYGADPNVIGKTLRLAGTANRSAYSGPTIVGVMPGSFLFSNRNVDLWSPSQDDAFFALRRELTWYTCVGRIKPGVAIAQARSNLAAVQSALGREFPKTDAELTTTVQPLKETTVGGVRSSLWILFGSVSLLLLIACANVAALLLSRAAARRQETAVRFSLGASRASVVGLMLSEVLILAVAGAALGLPLAFGAVRVFRALGRNLPRVDEIVLDWRILLYTLVCAFVAALLCGILPALRAARRGFAQSAREGRATVSGGSRVHFTLVGVQVALAVTLLAGAALLIRSLQQLGRVSPGFEPEHVLTFHISSSWGETADRAGSKLRAERILEELRAVPGVAATANSLSLPGVPADYQVEFDVGEGRAAAETKVTAQGRAVSPTYFAALQIPLLAGEICRDDGNLRAAMVNRSFANTFFAGASPIGLHLSQPGNVYVSKSVIRGVVADARETGLDREPVPTVYWCSASWQPGTYFLVRTHGDPRALTETVRKTVHAVEPRRSVYDITPLVDQISGAYAENRLRTVLLVFFAAAAILLACVGLYGTISYSVTVRRREVGLRLALGALRPQIVRQVLAQGLTVAAIGCVAGLLLAGAFTRLLSGMLYGVSATDPAALAGVVVMVLLVTAAASLIPAVRAARLDPMRVLREE
jgi:putative ABC transport system permease protein